ncbi:unnamed protein product [Periconia digitata]|uniref:S-adenosyl-L-methionine-dependent methyltransferase n=1 Tax=Periconia digitata TaxID=1303443 RepID=A0A9W4UMN7_9PLEO|nr:unnamed protein product [Periconia digitata]
MTTVDEFNATDHVKEKEDYFMASDEEAQRLSNQHWVIKDAMPSKQLVCAPVDMSRDQLCILDSGTADGTWILDLNKETGGRHIFVGTDVLESQLPTVYPSNATFHAHDINNAWPKEYKEYFDLIHQRLTLPFAGNKCKESLSALMDMVKPGGWIQLMEGTLLTTDSVEVNPCMHNYLKIVHAIYKSLGAPLTLSRDIPQWLKEAGFVNVETREIHVQMGASNKDTDLGKRGAATQRDAAKGMVEAARKLPKLPISEKLLDTFVEDFTRELGQKGACFPIMAIWAQK